MNKTAIKNFATWARNKLISDITYKAGLLGITAKGISDPLPQSTRDMQFFDIGTSTPYAITGDEIAQRRRLVGIIESRAKHDDYQTAFNAVVEEVAYTWFNRLIAVRFMEVNDYLPSRIRVLSSESPGKAEPDLVTTPFDADLPFTDKEKALVAQLKQDNKLDELFRLLFVKQCQELGNILPVLFNTTNDQSILLTLSFTDKESVVWRLVNDIPHRDFQIRTQTDDEAIARGDLSEDDAPAGQVEIIGWLYQYYNTEPKQEVFDLLKKNVKITKVRIPAATQLFTPDWIVRYMVENSLGRLWLERHPNTELRAGWKYYVDEAEQEPAVAEQLHQMRVDTPINSPEDITFIDPCMGSGHILVYAFDVLMQIYESCGYSARDAAELIIQKNLYGLDIDKRAYQLAHFSVTMKARQYNRRILSEGGGRGIPIMCFEDAVDIDPQLATQWGNKEFDVLLAEFKDVDTYGSLLIIKGKYDLDRMQAAIQNAPRDVQTSLTEIPFAQILGVTNLAKMLTQQYDVVCTNPPYMGGSGMNGKLADFVKKEYPDAKGDLFACFIERGLAQIKSSSYNCMVTMQSWMFLSSFEKLRKNILEQRTIANLMHMENMVMGIAFGTAVANLLGSHVKNYIGQYNHITMADIQNDKPVIFPPVSKRNTTANAENFTKIPGMPVAYWFTREMFLVFANGVPLGRQQEVRGGLTTGDNDRFLRFWHEVNINNIAFSVNNISDTENLATRWYPLAKGGGYRKWYGNMEYVVNWLNNGEEAKNWVVNNPSDPNTKSWSRRLFNTEHYFKKIITWSGISSGEPSMRISDHAIFGSGAKAIIPSSGFDFFIAFMNSIVALELLKAISPTLNYESGHIASLPIIYMCDDDIDNNVDSNLFISRQDWDSLETSWDFTRHPLRKFGISLPGLVDSVNLYKVDPVHVEEVKTDDSYFMRMVGQENNYRMETSYREYKKFVETQFLQLKSNEEELNRIFIDIYGLQDELTPEVADKDVTVARIYDSKEDIPESMKGNGYVLTKADVVKSFISYAVGCMFGRYSLDVDGLAYAGGEWDAGKYSTFIPDKDNILPITDEEYYEDDIVGLFVAFVKKVYGTETLEENLDFIANALGGKGSSSREVIRGYFVKDFFKDHCKTYQKRPIYWLFDSGKADGFKALVYLHRYDENTIGNLRIDYLHRIQQVYTREIARMQETIDNSQNGREVTAAEKRKEKLTKQLKEARDYDEKIAHLAIARIAIDLDDGVKVNYEKVQTDAEGNKLDVLAKIG